ncbi:hypothetical protein GN316_12780 [Xylophilus sp. Kf1]|nr:hypothetical protein [Xylophilus sp. Kf1]
MIALHRFMPPLALPMAAACLAALPATAHAFNNASTDSSAASLLPLAISVAAPVMIFSAGMSLVVVSVQASAVGTVWVLERASDGAQASVALAGHAAVAVGSVLACAVIGSGVILSAAGQVVAFVPNAIGEALLYNERITR